MSVEAARLFLDKDEDYILGAVECGLLTWAWDIRGKNATRREVRIWAPCVFECAKFLRENTISSIDDREHGVIFLTLWNHSRPVLISTELCRVWNCGSTHVRNLLRDGLMETTKPMANLNASEAAPITRESVEKFMEERRL